MLISAPLGVFLEDDIVTSEFFLILPRQDCGYERSSFFVELPLNLAIGGAYIGRVTVLSSARTGLIFTRSQKGT